MALDTNHQFSAGFCKVNLRVRYIRPEAGLVVIEQRLFDAIDGHNRPAATHCTVNLTSIWAFEVAAVASPRHLKLSIAIAYHHSGGKF